MIDIDTPVTASTEEQIKELEEKNKKLKEENIMLTECLLEISQIIYS